jgi:hypothetical protein
MSLKRRLMKLEHKVAENLPPSPVVVYTVNTDGSVIYRGETYESKEALFSSLPDMPLLVVPGQQTFEEWDRNTDQITSIAIHVVEGRKDCQ